MNKKQDDEVREKQIKRLVEAGTEEDKSAIARGREDGRRLRTELEDRQAHYDRKPEKPKNPSIIEGGDGQ